MENNGRRKITDGLYVQGFMEGWGGRGRGESPLTEVSMNVGDVGLAARLSRSIFCAGCYQSLSPLWLP